MLWVTWMQRVQAPHRAFPAAAAGEWAGLFRRGEAAAAAALRVASHRAAAGGEGALLGVFHRAGTAAAAAGPPRVTYRREEGAGEGEEVLPVASRPAAAAAEAARVSPRAVAAEGCRARRGAAEAEAGEGERPGRIACRRAGAAGAAALPRSAAPAAAAAVAAEAVRHPPLRRQLPLRLRLWRLRDPAGSRYSSPSPCQTSRAARDASPSPRRSGTCRIRNQQTLKPVLHLIGLQGLKPGVLSSYGWVDSIQLV
jgi:hypothetical protein